MPAFQNTDKNNIPALTEKSYKNTRAKTTALHQYPAAQHLRDRKGERGHSEAK